MRPRNLDTPVIRQVVRNPRGAEGVAAYRRINSRMGSTAAHMRQTSPGSNALPESIPLLPRLWNGQ